MEENTCAHQFRARLAVKAIATLQTRPTALQMGIRSLLIGMVLIMGAARALVAALVHSCKHATERRNTHSNLFRLTSSSQRQISRCVTFEVIN